MTRLAGEFWERSSEEMRRQEVVGKYLATTRRSQSRDEGDWKRDGGGKKLLNDDITELPAPPA